MSNDTHETARTRFVQVGDVRFAYRRSNDARGGKALGQNGARTRRGRPAE
jgi:hypothetical protein